MKKLYITVITVMLIFIFILLTINFSRAATITSVQSGNWSNNNTWDCTCVPAAGDNVVVGTHIITVNNNFSVTDLDVTIGGILTSNGKTLTITGNFTIDGFIGGSIKLTVSGTNNITGSGTISTSGAITLTGGDKTILGGTSIDNSQATLSVITIDAGVTVTNNGFWISGAEIKGNAASSTWVQGAGSSLRVGNKMLTTGTLDASGIGNTMEYYEDGNQSIKTASGAYYNLVLSGSGNKTLSFSIDIDGDLMISSGNFDLSTFDVNIAGNWTNTGSFTPGSQMASFDGASSQIINTAGGETFYDFESNNSGSGIISLDNITVTNELAMTAGNIDIGSFVFTLGTSTSNFGTLTYTTGNIIGKFKRWTGVLFGSFLWPIGTQTNSRRVSIVIPPFDATHGTWTWEFIESDPGTNGYSFVDGSTYYNPFTEGYWESAAGDGFTVNTVPFTMGIVSEGMNSFALDNSTLITFRANAASPWVGSGGPAGFFDPWVTSVTLDNSFVTGQWCFSDPTNCAAPVSPVISGSSAVCNGDLGEIYSVAPSTDTYTWTVTGGTIVSANPASSITVNWGVVTGIESVVVVASNGCTSAFPVTYPVKIGPLPTSSPPTGKTNVADLTPDEPYSVVNEAGYTYTWTIMGGTLDLGQGTSSITVDWGVEGTGNVSVVGSNGCGSAPAEAFDVTIYDAIESDKTGNYGTNNTWTSNSTPLTTESFRIMPTHAVKLTGSEEIVNVTIEPGGILNLNGNNLTVTGDITMHGFVIGTGHIILSGNGTSIDGAGLFQNSGDISITGGGKTMVAPTALSKANGDLTIANNITVTNNGVFTLDGSLTGGNVNSRFINAANSTLSVAGTLLSVGVLVSNANVNTVNYSGLVDQTIFPTTYYDLGSSGDGIKSLTANTDINGELAISDDASLDVTVSDFNIDLGGDWNNTSIDADPFVERGATVTFDGSVSQDLTATVGETFNDLTINNTSTTGVTLSDPITINNQLTLTDGYMYSSAVNLLTLIDGATSSSGSISSFVDGPVRKIGDNSFVFPTGDDVAPAGAGIEDVWARIGITAPAGLSDEFTASYTGAPYVDLTIDGTLMNVSTLEYWTLDRAVGSSNEDVTLYWEDAARSVITDPVSADLIVARYDGVDWTDNGQSAISGSSPGWVTSTAVTGGTDFNTQFTFGSNGGINPLPITLVEFYAVQYDDFLELNWSTADETNNDYFTIEKSTNFETEFIPIGKVEGAGNSSKLNEYSLRDPSAIPGFNYYRLKQTDFSGEYTYSKIIVVKVDDFSKFVVYPNPSQGILNIKVPKIGGNRTLKIFDQFGAQIFLKVLENREDYITIHSGFDEGLYIVRITDGFQSFNQKFIVNK